MADMPPTGEAPQTAAQEEAFEFVNHDEANGAEEDVAAEKAEAMQQAQEEGDSPQLFSHRKPRDALAGLSSAAKSVAKGIVGGAAVLVSAPVIGASQEGVKGFVKGIGVGVVGAAVLSTGGIATGAIQVGRGIANTPTAVKQKLKGRYWDKRTRKWVDYDPNLAVQLESEAPTGNAAIRQGTPAKDTSLYDVLSLTPDASDGEIKKAYYKLARELHPDKNPDDPEAHDKFQKVSQAYQVLSNPTLRQQYNERGSDGIGEENIMESSTFYAMLFGSDQFEHLIGELQMTATMRLGQNEIEVERAQIARIATLSQRLQERLFTWELGNHKKFSDEARAEAKKLLSTSYGDVILLAVARAYENSANSEGIGGLTGLASSFRSFGQSMGRYINVVSATKNVFDVQTKAAEQHKKKQKAAKKAMDKANAESSSDDDDDSRDKEDSDAGLSPEELAELEQTALPAILKVMWSTNAIDIADTLKKVCKAVLRGGHGVNTVPKETRLVRAHGLIELSKVFREVVEALDNNPSKSKSKLKGKKGDDIEDAKSKLQQAAFAAHMKQHEDAP